MPGRTDRATRPDSSESACGVHNLVPPRNSVPALRRAAQALLNRSRADRELSLVTVPTWSRSRRVRVGGRLPRMKERRSGPEWTDRGRKLLVDSKATPVASTQSQLPGVVEPEYKAMRPTRLSARRRHQSNRSLEPAAPPHRFHRDRRNQRPRNLCRNACGSHASHCRRNSAGRSETPPRHH